METGIVNTFAASENDAFANERREEEIHRVHRTIVMMFVGPGRIYGAGR